MKLSCVVFMMCLCLVAQQIRADDATLPGDGFPAARYEALWTKSPFAVATSETEVDASPDYMLVGIANIEGISYASVIEAKPPQEHFLISTDKPNRGMTLVSITRNGSDTFAQVQKGGQTLTLKLEQAPAEGSVPGAPQIAQGMPPFSPMPPQIQMPGGQNGFVNPYSARPMPRFHRAPIHLPPPPQPQNAATPAQ